MPIQLWRGSKALLKAVDVSVGFTSGDFAKVIDSGFEYSYVYNSAGVGGDTDTYIDATTGAGGWDLQSVANTVPETRTINGTPLTDNIQLSFQTPVEHVTSDPVTPELGTIWLLLADAGATDGELCVKTAAGILRFAVSSFTSD